MPLVRAEVDRLHDAIFAEMTFHAAYQPLRAVRTERWKYIRRFDDYPHPVLANCDDSATKELLVEHGWGEQLVPEEQLSISCSIRMSLATCRVIPRDQVLDMLREARGWMEQTEDPLLRARRATARRAGQRSLPELPDDPGRSPDPASIKG